MKWPLKYQIFVSLLIILLLATLAITVTNIRIAWIKNRQQENLRILRIEDALSTSRFPLTQGVLESMKALAGAELVRIGSNHSFVAGTMKVEQTEDLYKVKDGMIIHLAGRNYSHSRIELKDRGSQSGPDSLHILVEQKSGAEILLEAGRGPVVVAAVVLPIAFLISLFVANQLAEPLKTLTIQVDKIADGTQQSIPDFQRTDEIGILGNAVNKMSHKIQEHEIRLRKNERLQTLIQVSSGIAHNLRNAVTGCKMAIQLMPTQFSQLKESDNFNVANRQLDLMETYIDKFMILSRDQTQTTPNRELEPTCLARTLESVMELLRPSAEHLKVTLEMEIDSDTSQVMMVADDAFQLMLNLINNAIQAASRYQAKSGGTAAKLKGRVVVSLKVKNKIVDFEVTDNGDGPPALIATTIFEPFVTGSQEGTGLGLAVVKEIADSVDGEVGWIRTEDETKFWFLLNQADTPFQVSQMDQ
ncbi:MAG: HAMP domain-containing sensor histidine kinase [Planctomycetota bacterium]